MVNFRELTKNNSGKKRDAASSEKRSTSKESESKFSQLGISAEERMPARSYGESEFSAEEMASIYRQASDYLDKVFAAVRGKTPFDIEEGAEIVWQMVDIPPHENALFIQAIQTDDKIAFLVNKSINVAIYAIRIGQQLGFDKRKLKEMGLAALLHEVGMCAIPEEILYKEGKLTDNEFQAIKQHSDLSFELLSGYNGKYGFLADVVLQVHERRDGSGYPAGLTEEEIHEYAQIIGLVDTYEAISHSRPQREKFSHFHTIKEIIKTSKKKFQRIHLKALLNCFSIFPLSSHVRLNSNAIGRVIEIHPDQPLKPKIQIVLDSQGRPVHTKRIVNLKENSLLYITDAVLEDELNKLSKTLADKPAKPRPPVSKPEDTQPFELEPSQSVAPSPIQINYKKSGPGSVLRSKWFAVGVMVVLVMTIALFLIFANRSGPPQTDGTETIGQDIEKQKSPVPDSEMHGSPLKQPTVSAEDAEQIDQAPAGEIERPPKTGKGIVSAPSQEGILTESATSTPIPANTEPDMFADTAAEVESGAAELEKTSNNENNVRIAAEIKTERPSFPYTILVGSFRQADRAKKAVDTLRGKSLQAYWTKVDLGENGIWYRVFAGHYKEAQQAEETAAQYHLTGAQVKRTAYAALVGTYLSGQKLSDDRKKLETLGYCPYTVSGIAGETYLFVGAFLTRKGAEDQHAELLLNGIESTVVSR